MKTFDELGYELAKLRQAKGLTQKELAQLAGLGQSTLARFETGGVAEFGSAKLLRLLNVLGCELAFTKTDNSFTLQDALNERMSGQ
ncbi:MAG: helix-turn-helix transcriptional regulator [Limnobacter sp.]|nr:helix-turn-helix transcriptional regulator [Limnobacter sp.]